MINLSMTQLEFTLGEKGFGNIQFVPEQINGQQYIKIVKKVEY